MSGSIDFSHHISIVDRKSRLSRILCAYCCKFSLYSCIGLLCVLIFALTFYFDFISVLSYVLVWDICIWDNVFIASWLLVLPIDRSGWG